MDRQPVQLARPLPVVGERVQIVAGDGKSRLSATVSTTANPDVTVVFCHGLGLHSAVWAPQIAGLRGRRRLRVVSYDQRGHGRSDPVDSATCSVEQLGDDLAAVLDAVAPGPVVLVGHSLGGMAILAFAAAHPNMVADRVVGAALLATAAAQTTGAGIARLLGGPVVPVLRALAHHRPCLLCHGWDMSRRALGPVIGRPWVSTVPAETVSVALATGAMIHRTDISTIVGFLAGVVASDQTRGLRALASVPTLIMCGTRDRVLPTRHSHRIAQALPGSELVLVPGAGHMIGLDSAAAVNAHIERLLQRALAYRRGMCAGADIGRRAERAGAGPLFENARTTVRAEDRARPSRSDELSNTGKHLCEFLEHGRPAAAQTCDPAPFEERPVEERCHAQLCRIGAEAEKLGVHGVHRKAMPLDVRPHMVAAPIPDRSVDVRAVMSGECSTVRCALLGKGGAATVAVSLHLTGQRAVVQRPSSGAAARFVGADSPQFADAVIDVRARGRFVDDEIANRSAGGAGGSVVVPFAAAGEDGEQARLCRVDMQVEVPRVGEFLDVGVGLGVLETAVEECDGDIWVDAACEVHSDQ